MLDACEVRGGSGERGEPEAWACFAAWVWFVVLAACQERADSAASAAFEGPAWSEVQVASVVPVASLAPAEFVGSDLSVVLAASEAQHVSLVSHRSGLRFLPSGRPWQALPVGPSPNWPVLAPDVWQSGPVHCGDPP